MLNTRLRNQYRKLKRLSHDDLMELSDEILMLFDQITAHKEFENSSSVLRGTRSSVATNIFKTIKAYPYKYDMNRGGAIIRSLYSKEGEKSAPKIPALKARYEDIEFDELENKAVPKRGKLNTNPSKEFTISNGRIIDTSGNVFPLCL